MTSPLLKVAASGKVDLTQSTIDMLANPEIVAGAEGTGRRQRSRRPLGADPDRGPAGSRPPSSRRSKACSPIPRRQDKTVKQIGEVMKKKFKGKPVGEAIGRFLGNVQIGPRNGNGGGEAEPPANKQALGQEGQPGQADA